MVFIRGFFIIEDVIIFVKNVNFEWNGYRRINRVEYVIINDIFSRNCFLVYNFCVLKGRVVNSKI